MLPSFLSIGRQPSAAIHGLMCLVVAALASTGCFQMSTTIRVNADASGTIQQRLVFTGAALAQLRQFAGLAGPNGKAIDPVSEEQARADAAKIGPDVTYVSSTPISDATGQGRETIYAFRDLRQLRVNQQPQAPGGITIRGDGINSDAATITFGIEAQPNGNTLMTISVPQPDLAAIPGAAGGGTGGPISPEQLAMAKQMFAGARVTIIIEPAGRLVRTNGPSVDGNRVTLFDVDLDQLLTVDTVSRLQASKTLDEVKATLKDVPGLKVPLDSKVMIEFTPAK